MERQVKVKICPVCKSKFEKKKDDGYKHWNKQIFCSIPCARKYRRGKPSGVLGKHWVLTEETKSKMSEAQKKRKFSKREIERVRQLGLANKGKYVGDKSPRWVGDKVGYAGLHDWVSTKLGKPKHCAKCNTTRDTKYEWANRSRKYKRDVTDWIRLCVSCHQKADYHKLPL